MAESLRPGSAISGMFARSIFFLSLFPDVQYGLDRIQQ